MKKLLVCSIAIAMMLAFVIDADAQGRRRGGVAIDDGGIGDVLLFSLYDLRVNTEDRRERSDEWENYLAIENTSGAWTAFHLRFRAWKKSIEVWDHVILLSPYDVFWLTLKRHDDGVEMFSADVETLKNSGLIWGDAIAWTDYFSPDLIEKNGFCEGLGQECLNNEMQAGYIEAIGLWQLSIPPAACGLVPGAALCREDVHDINLVVNDINNFRGPNGESGVNVYDILDGLFYRLRAKNVYLNNGEVSSWYLVDDSQGVVVDSAWPSTPGFSGPVMLTNQAKSDGCFESSYECGSAYEFQNQRYGVDCGNVLTGVFFMTDEDTGRFQMENFIALEDFRTDMYRRRPWEHMYYSYSVDNILAIAGGDQNGLRDAVQMKDRRWRHRDGYQGGGIFFPATTTKWFYGFEYSTTQRVYAGGDEVTYLWYYVQPNWATVAGPTLIDGDDYIGVNWNDVNAWYPWSFPKTNLPVDNYGYQQPLGDPGPTNWFQISFDQGYFVHYFNDIFSLDDVEAALGKGSIWSTYFSTRLPDAKQNTFTDVVLTYPTKHNHWFFADWPLMWKWGFGQWFPVQRADWEEYINYVNDYRGDFIDPMYGKNMKKDVEELLVGIDHDPKPISDWNQDDMTIAEWFQYAYHNGQIVAGAYVWDMEQNPCTPLPPEGPPPSPVPPSPLSPIIPHEVNIVRAGTSFGDYAAGTWDHTGIGIGDANELLTCAQPAISGPAGHFMITTSVMLNGQRGAGQWFVPWSSYISPEFIPFTDSYLIPNIGVVIVQNDQDEGPVTRSAMAEWHYTGWSWFRFDAIGDIINEQRDGLGALLD